MRGLGNGPAPGGPGERSQPRAHRPSPGRGGGRLLARTTHHRGLPVESQGPRFLGRLYRRITRSEGSFLLITEAQDTAVGFIAGSVALGRLYRSFLLRDGVAASLSAPIRLVTAPPRVLETLRHGGETVGAGAELLAVAVDPQWRDRHVGSQLVEGFLHELERRGVGAAHVVVGADNAAAIAMYRRAGFAPVRTFEMHRGTSSVLMQTSVPSRAVPTARRGL